MKFSFKVTAFLFFSLLIGSVGFADDLGSLQQLRLKRSWKPLIELSQTVIAREEAKKSDPDAASGDGMLLRFAYEGLYEGLVGTSRFTEARDLTDKIINRFTATSEPKVDTPSYQSLWKLWQYRAKSFITVQDQLLKDKITFLKMARDAFIWQNNNLNAILTNLVRHNNNLKSFECRILNASQVIDIGKSMEGWANTISNYEQHTDDVICNQRISLLDRYEKKGIKLTSEMLDSLDSESLTKKEYVDQVLLSNQLIASCSSLMSSNWKYLRGQKYVGLYVHGKDFERLIDNMNSSFEDFERFQQINEKRVFALDFSGSYKEFQNRCSMVKFADTIAILKNVPFSGSSDEGIRIENLRRYIQDNSATQVITFFASTAARSLGSSLESMFSGIENKWMAVSGFLKANSIPGDMDSDGQYSDNDMKLFRGYFDSFPIILASTTNSVIHNMNLNGDAIISLADYSLLVEAVNGNRKFFPCDSDNRMGDLSGNGSLDENDVAKFAYLCFNRPSPKGDIFRIMNINKRNVPQIQDVVSLIVRMIFENSYAMGRIMTDVKYNGNNVNFLAEKPVLDVNKDNKISLAQDFELMMRQVAFLSGTPVPTGAIGNLNKDEDLGSSDLFLFVYHSWDLFKSYFKTETPFKWFTSNEYPKYQAYMYDRCKLLNNRNICGHKNCSNMCKETLPELVFKRNGGALVVTLAGYKEHTSISSTTQAPEAPKPAPQSSTQNNGIGSSEDL
ncbi:MAG: hypothetical protein HQM10_25085 [Candidatus Riflebacteria bacterium]|nr:hypothetical protein [Candidatus Riflebacteria bacterium]